MDTLRIMITGHRPDKLYGYDMNDKKYNVLDSMIREAVENIITEHERNCITPVPDYNIEFISGMAIGADTLFALVANDMKVDLEGVRDASLTCAIPFDGQEKRWPLESKKVYRMIMEHCSDKTVYVDKVPGYESLEYREKFLKRNMWMVDNSDYVIAVWDGSTGGTSHCVKYAQKKINPERIKYIHPQNIFSNLTDREKYIQNRDLWLREIHHTACFITETNLDSFKNMVALGDKIVPWIVSDLKKYNSRYLPMFTLLPHVTGKDIKIPEYERGHVYKMAVRYVSFFSDYEPSKCEQ